MVHSFIYLGKERGKRVIYKVGQTKQTCYARCKCSDYLIGMGIEIKLSPSTLNKELNSIEREILKVFSDKFPIEHGNEYFRMKKYDWDMSKDFFLIEMLVILRNRGLNYTIYDEWVKPNTY